MALRALNPSQCTFWCSVLSDTTPAQPASAPFASLNAPSGAQCFPTCETSFPIRRRSPSLNAPSGAQCFPTERAVGAPRRIRRVSMHLLVLSAFRLEAVQEQVPDLIVVSMHLLVLSAFRLKESCAALEKFLSQCTFWCSVLSDSAPRKPRHTAVYRNEIAADLESTTSNRPAHVQLNHTTAKNRHKTPSAADAPYPPVRHRLPTNPSQKTDTSQLRHGKHRNQGHRRLPPRRHDGPLPADRFAWADRRIPLTSPSR